ncbi:unnamed protein product [Rhizophagus irregularis]|nr:unnamed protein product [Rhizophagus irregularis]
MASRNNKNFPPPVTRNENEKSNLEEEKAVDMIKDWRNKKKEEEIKSDISESDEEDYGINTMEETANRPLRRENVDTEEVIDIIRDYRTNKICL